MPPADVGFVGAGRMGEPMVGRLLAAGHRVVVCVRRSDVAARLTAAGATVTTDVAAAAADVPLFVACLFSDDQLTAVAPTALAALPAGAAFVSHVSGRVDTLATLAGPVDGRVDVLDGPVSGTADDIRAGRLTVLLGGPPGAVAATSKVLAAYADPVVATGDLGSALVIKLLNNLLFAANTQLAAETARYGEQLGIPTGRLLAAVAACSGASAAAGYLAAGKDVARHGAAIAPFLAKDVDACVAAAAAAGLDPALLLDVVRRGPLPLIG